MGGVSEVSYGREAAPSPPRRRRELTPIPLSP